MPKRKPSRLIDPDHTLGGRLAAALVSLFLSLPVCGLLWLAINYRLAVMADLALTGPMFLWCIGGIAVFAFVFPKLFPTVFGWLVEAVFSIGKYW